jgi:hypothetical protein
LLKMDLNIFLNHFIEMFNTQGIISQTIFTELYDENIIPASNQLQNEIKINVITLPIADREYYLEYVKKRIEAEIVNHCDKSNIDKWIQHFELDLNEFPFVDNEMIKIKLSTWHNQPGLDYKSKKDLLKLQKDFFLHSFYLESNKIIELINSLLPSRTIVETNSNKIKLNYFKIKAGYSKTNKAKTLFESLVAKNHIDPSAKKDFIKAFTGTPPINKINWIGNFGDLKTLINQIIKIEFIEKVTYKWVLVANIFLIDGSDFTSQQIKDTKETSNKTELNKIINSLI